MCGFNRRVGELQAQPKLQPLVARLRKRRQEEVAKAKKRVYRQGGQWRMSMRGFNRR